MAMLCLSNITVGLFAQPTPIFTQYMQLPYLVNPAVAGSEGVTEYSLISRSEWIGIEYAPYTNMMSFQTRLLKSKYSITRNKSGNAKYKNGRSGRIGMGGYFYNDVAGKVERTGLQYTYAYHVFIRNTQLSFGVSANVHQLKISPNIRMKREDDPIKSKLGAASYTPDANIGAYVRGAKYYVGLSIGQLLESQIKFSGNQKDVFESYRLDRQYYLMGGYLKELKNLNFNYEPSFLFKTTESLQLQLDITNKFVYKEKYWFGPVVRSTKAAGIFFGAKLSKLHLGYGYDYTFGSFLNQNYGSHEFLLSLKFGDSVRRYTWMKRF